RRGADRLPPRVDFLCLRSGAAEGQPQVARDSLVAAQPFAAGRALREMPPHTRRLPRRELPAGICRQQVLDVTAQQAVYSPIHSPTPLQTARRAAPPAGGRAPRGPAARATRRSFAGSRARPPSHGTSARRNSAARSPR